LSFLAK